MKANLLVQFFQLITYIGKMVMMMMIMMMMIMMMMIMMMMMILLCLKAG